MDLLFNKSAFTMRKRAYPAPAEKVLSRNMANELLGADRDVEKEIHVEEVESLGKVGKVGKAGVQQI
jgi:hypothetical protein